MDNSEQEQLSELIEQHEKLAPGVAEAFDLYRSIEDIYSASISSLPYSYPPITVAIDTSGVVLRLLSQKADALH